jgi:putative ABC transport system permease protein
MESIWRSAGELQYWIAFTLWAQSSTEHFCVPIFQPSNPWVPACRVRLVKNFHLLAVLLVRTTLRHWRRNLGQYCLLVLIVAVGVGAFNGIRQASRAATANFGLFNQAVSGTSDFIIEPLSNSITARELEALRWLSFNPEYHLVPVLEGVGAILDENLQPAYQIRLLGVDPISLMNIRGQVGRVDFTRSGDSWHDTLSREKDVWIGPAAAEMLALKAGMEVSMICGGEILKLRIHKVLEDDQNQIPDDLFIGDIPTVEKILRREGELDRIEVMMDRLDSRDDKAYLDKLEEEIRSGLPPGLRVSPTINRAGERAAMTSAFRLNLSILSLIAMLVGAYLILQALDASVIRRRSEIAILRSLGVSQNLLFSCFLLESLFLGCLGSVLGIGLGYLLALGAIGTIADTVNALYFSSSLDALSLTKMDILIGISLGTVFSLLAGWLPARDAMQTPPAQILTREDWSPGFIWLRKPHTGSIFLLFGTVTLWFPPSELVGGSKVSIGGFLSAGVWILGAALLSGQVLVWISGLALKGFSSPVPRIALSRLRDGSSRHRLAVAGLVVAVGMVTGMFQLTNSFRDTIRKWFDVRFQADLYLSERGVSGAASAANGIAPQVLDALLAEDSIEYADVFYNTKVRIDDGITYLAGVNLDSWTSRIEQIWIREPGTLQPMENAEPSLISEAFARRFCLLDGGVVSIETINGTKQISPYGVYADYGNEFGTASIDVNKWKEWTGSERATNISLFLKDVASVQSLRDQLRLQFPGLEVRNQQELKAAVIRIFNQTFSSTVALNIIGLIVAFFGLSLGLFAIFDESSRTWVTLSHLGLSRNQLLLIAGIEGCGISLAAWICGSLLGMAIGGLLIYVINVQSFGWTLLWSMQIPQMLSFGGVLLMFGFLCGCASAALWHSKIK